MIRSGTAGNPGTAAIGTPSIKDRFASLTFDSSAGSPDDFRKLLVAEDLRWKGVLKQVKIQLE